MVKERERTPCKSIYPKDVLIPSKREYKYKFSQSRVSCMQAFPQLSGGLDIAAADLLTGTPGDRSKGECC